MTKKAMKTGKELEQRVANVYREMGARKVEHDVRLVGNQIDVYVELDTADRGLHRIAVEAKDWTSVVGIDVVNNFALRVRLLRDRGKIDRGVIVSASGFSKEARDAAKEYGIRLLEPTDLDAMVVGAKVAREKATPVPIPPMPPSLQKAQDTPTKAGLPIEELPTFIAGPPITHPRHFFGRKREVRRLFNLWKRPPLQNAAVIGPRRSGKTSLLLHLKNITITPTEQLRPSQHANWLPKPERYRWILVDFQDPRLGTREGLLRYLLTCLNLPMPHPCDLERCMDVVSRGLRNPTVILLDEIGVALQRYPELDDSFWESLRSLAATQVGGNLAFVLAAGESPAKLANTSSLGSPFFNIFGYTATLGGLTKPEARELITSSPIPFPPADVDWILKQSGRWPILLQILCRERLITLEEGETGDTWREDGLGQMVPFRHLLDFEL
jgi:hypothetical protein